MSDIHNMHFQPGAPLCIADGDFIPQTTLAQTRELFSILRHAFPTLLCFIDRQAQEGWTGSDMEGIRDLGMVNLGQQGR